MMLEQATILESLQEATFGSRTLTICIEIQTANLLSVCYMIGTALKQVFLE